MNTVESAINLGLMCDEDGVQYIYNLANTDLSKEEKTSILRDYVSTYIYYVLQHGAYEMEDQDETTDSYESLNYNFLTTMFGSILHTVDWDNIIAYHQEVQQELDKLFGLC